MAYVFPKIQSLKNMFRQTIEIDPFESTLRQSTFQSAPNTYEICMTPPLSNFSITLIVTNWGNIYINHMLTLRTLS